MSQLNYVILRKLQNFDTNIIKWFNSMFNQGIINPLLHRLFLDHDIIFYF